MAAAISRLDDRRLPTFASSRSTISWPRPAYWRRTAARVARLMAARALPVTASPSQAAGGTCASERMISTSSPFSSCGHQRRVAAIDAAADAAVADAGVNGIGEVDRRRAARQGDELALGREAEDLVLEQLELGVLEEFARAFAFRQHLDQMAQPAIGVGFGRRRRGSR